MYYLHEQVTFVFFSFPANELIAQQWISAVGILKIRKFTVICANHFENNCFYSHGTKTVLLPGSFPTKNLGQSVSKHNS